jgi:hypothetical protein
MLDCVAFEMAPVEPSHQPLDIGDQSNADLRERRVEDLVVREPLSPERLLDELVEGVDLVVGYPAYAFTPDPGRPKDLALPEVRREQDRKIGDDVQVLLTHPVIGPRVWQAESCMDLVEQDEWDPQLVTDLGVCATGARRRIGERVQVGERQRTAGDCRSDSRRRDAGSLQLVDQLDPEGVSASKRSIRVGARCEDADLHELSHALPGGTGAPRDLLFAQAHE